MIKRKKLASFLIGFAIFSLTNVTAALISPKNVCKTFEGYYTNRDCYYNPDQVLEVPDLVRRYNYSLEEYEITTPDDYFLKIFRIPSKDPNGEPVLLQHGVLASSENFLIIGNSSLGFVLANEGYDVWLGNFRGTRYSNKHRYLRKSDREYWNFSFDELGSFDVQSTIDLIHRTTKQPAIYIGYSLGAIAGHVYSSAYPDEAENKVKVMISMAPATLIETSKSILRFFRPYWNLLQRLVNVHNHGELFTRDGPLIKYIRSVCFPYPHQLKMCLGFIQLAFGINEDQINPETLPITLYHDGDSISIKTVVHLSQVAMSRKFHKFDYGMDVNLRVYNSSTPPLYNLNSIKVPNYLMYGRGDFVAGKKAVFDLYKQLSKRGRKYGVYAIKHPSFAHTDFMIGKDVKELVYDHIVEFLRKLKNH
ncbi:hypothetical protein Trydic_g18226 [Trypoxylus dichotomus]